jgi:predicted dehydrogenase
MSMSNIPVAFIGAGAMAREHIRAFADVPGVTLAGIHSRTRAAAEALAAQHRIAHVCDSIADLHARTQAALVVSTVSVAAHHAVTLECLAYPWTVFIEKPPGLTPAETVALAQAAEGQGRALYVGFNRRFLSSTQAALSDLATVDGRRYIHVQDQQNQAFAAQIGHPSAVVAHWMYVNSIHTIDYLRVFGRGRVVNVTPIFAFNPQAPGIVAAALTFESGDQGVYEAIWDGPGPWAVSISTPAVRWELRPLEEASYQRQGERARHAVEVSAHDRTFKPGFRAQAQAVLDAVQGEPSTVPNIHDALETMRLIERIYFPDSDRA